MSGGRAAPASERESLPLHFYKEEAAAITLELRLCEEGELAPPASEGESLRIHVCKENGLCHCSLCLPLCMCNERELHHLWEGDRALALL